MKNKLKIILSILIIGLVALGGWKYYKDYKANAPIDIGHPQKGDFVIVGEMSEPRYNHQTVLLDDGTVLVFGGMTLSKNYEGGSYTADIYDPNTKKFTPVGNMNLLRKEFAVTKLNDGRVLITGGRVGNNSVKSTEIYNPKTKTFEKGPDMNFKRENHTSTLLKDGKVLIAGTKDGFQKSEIYDPIKNKFKIAPKMNDRMFEHSAILLDSGKVLMIGGFGFKNGKLYIQKNAEIYNPKTNKFEFVGNLNIPRRTPNLYLLKSGNVLISGGIKKQDKDKGMDSIYAREIEIYNPKTNEFKIIAKRTSEPNMPAEVLLKDDKLLFTGSQTGVGLSLRFANSSEIFDPKTRKFTQGKGMNYNRSCHRMTRLKDGNVLISGNYSKGKTAELYIYNYKD